MFLPKTIALLELTGSGLVSNDKTVKNTLEFYWNNYPDEFKSFPIVNTNSELSKTIEFLEIYYKQGFRYFLGFGRSTIVAGVLEWFNNHPDAVGISTTSTAPILSVPKKIYRITANDDFLLESIITNLETSSIVYYFYDENELACLNVLEILENNQIISPKLKKFPIESDYSNLTVQNVNIFFENPNSSQSSLLYIFQREKYIDLYNQGLTFPGQQYDILGIQQPVILGNASIQLNNKYNITNFKGIETSLIWRKGLENLGPNNYSIVTLNCLNLLNTLVSNNQVNNINSHFSIVQFDQVSRDIIYPTFLVETFVSGVFKKNYLIIDDPILGTYQANFIV